MAYTMKKLNKVVTVSESEKNYYLADGYDVVEFVKQTKKYKVVEEATGGKTYTVAEYNKLKEENKSLKEEDAKKKK